MFAGLYLAFNPATYIHGLLQLTPLGGRARAAEVLAACGAALHRWLLGQLVSMLLVGGTVGLGLWWVGARSPLALGVLAGLGQFVPVIGPMAATLPGLIVAAGAAPEPLAWTAAIYLGASQFEANVVTPLLLRKMVELPMAVTYLRSWPWASCWARWGSSSPRRWRSSPMSSSALSMWRTCSGTGLLCPQPRERPHDRRGRRSLDGSAGRGPRRCAC